MKKLFILMASAAFILACNDDDDKGTTTPASGSISITENVVMFDSEGQVVTGSASLTVTSNENWTVVGKQDWATPSSSSGTSGSSVSLSVDPNTTGQDREQSFIFVSGNATAELKVIQTAVGVDIYEDTWNIPRAARNVWAFVMTDSDRTNYTIDVDWITPVRVTNDAEVAVFSVTENTGYAMRTGRVIFLPGTPDETVFTVNQTGIPNLTYTGDTTVEADLDGDEFTVTFTTNMGTYAYQSVSWLSYEEVSSTPVDDAYIQRTYKVKVAEGEAYRSGTFTVTDGTNNFTVSVVQADPDPELFEIPDATFAARLVTLGYIREDDTQAGEYYITEAGLTATSLTIGSTYTMASVEGIERLPNLTTVSLTYNMIKKLDLSKNTKVTSLSLNYNPVEELILGDCGVTSLTLNYLRGGNSSATYQYSENLKVSSSNLETLNIAYTSSIYSSYDELITLDVSQCPALKSLDARRYKNILTRIYVKRDQEIETVQMNSNAALTIR